MLTLTDQKSQSHNKVILLSITLSFTRVKYQLFVTCAVFDLSSLTLYTNCSFVIFIFAVLLRDLSMLLFYAIAEL